MIRFRSSPTLMVNKANSHNKPLLSISFAFIARISCGIRKTISALLYFFPPLTQIKSLMKVFTGSLLISFILISCGFRGNFNRQKYTGLHKIKTTFAETQLEPIEHQVIDTIPANENCISSIEEAVLDSPEIAETPTLNDEIDNQGYSETSNGLEKNENDSSTINDSSDESIIDYQLQDEESDEPTRMRGSRRFFLLGLLGLVLTAIAYIPGIVFMVICFLFAIIMFICSAMARSREKNNGELEKENIEATKKFRRAAWLTLLGGAALSFVSLMFYVLFF